MKTFLSSVFRSGRAYALLAAGCAALLLGACTTTDSRAQSNPQIMSRLSPTDRALVLSGRVREGLGKEATYIAYGRPDRIYRGVMRGNQAEAWIYTTNEVRYGGGYGYGFFPTPLYTSRFAYYGGYGGRYGGRRYGGYGYGGYGYGFGDPYFYRTPTVEVPVRRVDFESGRIVGVSERQY